MEERKTTECPRCGEKIEQLVFYEKCDHSQESNRIKAEVEKLPRYSTYSNSVNLRKDKNGEILKLADVLKIVENKEEPIKENGYFVVQVTNPQSPVNYACDWMRRKYHYSTNEQTSLCNQPVAETIKNHPLAWRYMKKGLCKVCEQKVALKRVKEKK